MAKKTKRNPWDPNARPYGSHDGNYGNPAQWKQAWEDRMGAEESAKILRGNKKSLHSLLNLPDSCNDPAEIKRAFRKLLNTDFREIAQSSESNPASPEITERFKEVRAAYSILMDKFSKD